MKLVPVKIAFGGVVGTLAVTACTPPPYATYVLTNASGAELQFHDCEGDLHLIPAGGELRVVDRRSWGIYVKCIFEDGLTMSTAGGESWFYDPNSLQRYPGFRFVYGALSYGDVTMDDERHPVFPMRVGQGGEISLGRFQADEAATGSARKVDRAIEYPARQPAGFPIAPSTTAQ